MKLGELLKTLNQMDPEAEVLRLNNIDEEEHLKEYAKVSGIAVDRFGQILIE